MAIREQLSTTFYFKVIVLKKVNFILTYTNMCIYNQEVYDNEIRKKNLVTDEECVVWLIT